MPPMKSGIRDQASGARKRAIVNAALDLFLEKGTNATTVDEIIERSGASVGSFYHHFQSKFDVGVALFLLILDEYCTGLLAEAS